MDLNEPLGMNPTPPSRRGLGLAVAALVVTVAVGVLSFFVATADPRGGEPYAIAAIPPRVAPPAFQPRPPLDPPTTASMPVRPPPPALQGAETSDMEAGVRVVRSMPDHAAVPTGPLVIDVSRVLDDPFGRRRVVVPGDLPGTLAPTVRPRVAIFVSGMGLSQAATRTAMETMPSAVTLAFVPYGSAVAASVARAKAQGHEILLQIPMQNASGGPPGPHALRPGESAEDAATDIGWLASRFEGYDGLTNLLGAPVAADSTVMTTLLKIIAARKLFYLDDGTSKRDVAPDLASGLGATLLRADVVLDATADASVVDANLERLLAIARDKGSAIGMASGLPDHMAAIAKFAREADGKGVTLVPVSALVGGGPAKSSVAAVTR